MPKLFWKWAVILVALIVSAVYLYPSFVWYQKPLAEREEMRKRHNPILQKILNLGLDLQGGIHLVLQLHTEQLRDDKPETLREAVDRAIEIIRNRIDASGLSEVLIVKQGDRWIVVQIPGVKDREEAKSLIGRTALLEFRLVEVSDDLRAVEAKIRELGLTANDIKPGQMPEQVKPLLPPGTEVLPGRENNFFLVKSSAEMTGASLQSARVEMGGSYSGYPVVSLEFNPEGTKQFAQVTAANVQRQLAVVLDGVVQSAPVIRTAIPDGRAVIEGNFTPDDAKLLKTVLQAGSLPAPLEIIEERSVGSTLGDDSIRSGLMAGAIGIGLVVIFMGIYYRWSGMIANIAVILNLFLLLACMAALHATLTMPGIAGIVLTIGMAVDANVLILERVREELAVGKTPQMALDLGYEKAFSAILDGNLTTMIAAAFMFQFGTGPVKGFGVSLMLGLIVSMFTAITVTRAIYELWLSMRPIKSLSV